MKLSLEEVKAKKVLGGCPASIFKRFVVVEGMALSLTLVKELSLDGAVS